MNRTFLIFIALITFIPLFASHSPALERQDVEFRVFQFPKEMELGTAVELFESSQSSTRVFCTPPPQTALDACHRRPGWNHGTPGEGRAL